ncbi:OLC1v1010462C1 [Oldenlandia corymbosa var. corymbosa]|uniref:OLC1v1010462C1 n=1 Tax=Oldenlandia corymbosa var. corymbosa TaxID=529605 RepID=A0AAV1DRH1_OLDCO|nr:OLC1v1010462C1 [Oldenlandia corymbosa var. corymbosa]
MEQRWEMQCKSVMKLHQVGEDFLSVLTEVMNMRNKSKELEKKGRINGSHIPLFADTYMKMFGVLKKMDHMVKEFTSIKLTTKESINLFIHLNKMFLEWKPHLVVVEDLAETAIDRHLKYDVKD